MSIFNALILDDELHGREIVKHLLVKNFPEVKIEALCKNLNELQKVYEQDALEPRILFMDIKLGDENSFDVFGTLNLSHTGIIFITGYSEYALQAFKVDAIEYLLKPLNESDFIKAVAKAKDQLYKRIGRDAICIKTIIGFEMVNLAQVTCVVADSNYTVFLLETGEEIIAAKSLNYFSNLLESNGFLRIHRSHFINVRKIKEYNLGKRVIVLSGGKELEVARSRHDDVVNLFRRNLII